MMCGIQIQISVVSVCNVCDLYMIYDLYKTAKLHVYALFVDRTF